MLSALLAGSAVILFATVSSASSRGDRVIALAPVGELPRAQIERLLPALQESFGTTIVIAPAVPLPASAYDAGRRQYLSTAILDALTAAKRSDWDRLLGVADVDLYVPELNFVFGEGDSRRGVAVFSLARLKSQDHTLFRRRAATEAIYELGHAYGLSHCEDSHCVMWFSNTLSESDRKGTRFCEKHRRQLDRVFASASRS